MKEERAARAAQVARRMHQAYLAGCVGKTYPVLFEQEKDGLYTGHAPNYMEVAVQGQALHNQVWEVTITACKERHYWESCYEGKRPSLFRLHQPDAVHQPLGR